MKTTTTNSGLSEDAQTVLDQLREDKTQSPSFGVGTDLGEPLELILQDLRKRGLVECVSDDEYGKWWQAV